MTDFKTLFVCDCGDVSHQMIISFDDDPDFNDTIFLEIHLTDIGFWRRLKYSIQYLLGKKSRYNGGGFSEVLLNKEKTALLIEALQKHYEVMN
jgi:hypothetical protein